MTYSARLPRRRRSTLIAGLLTAAMVASLASVDGLGGPRSAAASPASQARRVAAVDAAYLRLAAHAIEAQGLATGALRSPIRSASPAVVILRTDEALIAVARRHDPSRRPADVRPVMGAVPYNLSHRLRHQPRHVRRWRTHTLHRFTHSVFVGGAYGVGAFEGVKVASFQKPDGVYVDPRLPRLRPNASIAEVALRSAMLEIGQPYVWGGAGPTTFDCSGLVMQAYAHAGIRLTHYTGTQWNQGRLIPGRDALPGDLILYGHSLFHVGMYLGAGWMLNAPFTGHYVDVVPVWQHVAGVVRP